MTLKEMKQKTFALIEEVDTAQKALTADPDLAAKMNGVISQVAHELARYKKIPRFAAIPVARGQLLAFADISRQVGLEVYQLGAVTGADHDLRAEGTVIRALSHGVLEIDCFVYPEAIDGKTPDSYEFSLSQDALEIMPYGVAADLLKSDPSADYGQVYRQRYLEMIQRLDPRYALPGIRLEGGYDL